MKKIYFAALLLAFSVAGVVSAADGRWWDGSDLFKSIRPGKNAVLTSGQAVTVSWRDTQGVAPLGYTVAVVPVKSPDGWFYVAKSVPGSSYAWNAQDVYSGIGSLPYKLPEGRYRMLICRDDSSVCGLGEIFTVKKAEFSVITPVSGSTVPASGPLSITWRDDLGSAGGYSLVLFNDNDSVASWIQCGVAGTDRTFVWNNTSVAYSGCMGLTMPIPVAAERNYKIKVCRLVGFEPSLANCSDPARIYLSSPR